MTNTQPNAATNSGTQKILAKDVHAKWDKISEQEAGNMKSTGDLSSQVQSKYGLSSDAAKAEVDTWASGRNF